MPIALYRKYRPTQLSDVVGQDKITKALQKSLDQNKISHAYLFIGPRGTGKTSVARIFAHAVNKFNYKLEDDYVDIIEIDGASNRGIDNIRDLREKANIAPTKGKYKIYIIDEVHMLTTEAFNALLKTLEEPPKHVIFIMATTDAHKVPITITSRAQSYTFELANPETMLEYLKTIAKKENISIKPNALEIIVKKGGGSFRDSLSLLDQISTLTDKTITKEQVINALGLPADEKIESLLKSYQNSDFSQTINILKDLLASGIKPETLTEELINYIINRPVPEYIPLLAKLPEVKAPFAEARLIVALKNGENQPTIPAVPIKTVKFDWMEFLQTVKDQNDTIHTYLAKSSHNYENNELIIYPHSTIAKRILESKNNLATLCKIAPNIKITIENPKPNSTKNDPTINKISAIMGGEVKKDGGENPFSK